MTRCANKHGSPTHGITEAIVGQFTRESLERAFLEQLAPGPVDVDAEREGLEGEMARLDKAIQNLVGAIEARGDLPALVARSRRSSASGMRWRRRSRPWRAGRTRARCVDGAPRVQARG